MAADHHVQQVWSGIVESERHFRYYDRLHSRMERYHVLLMVIIGIGSTGAAVSLLGYLPDLVAAVMYFVVAAAAAIAFVADFSKKSAIASVICSQYANVTTDWKRLWRRLDEMEPEDVLDRADDLERMQAIIDGSADQCGSTDNALNERVTREANDVLYAEFSQQGD